LDFKNLTVFRESLSFTQLKSNRFLGHNQQALPEAKAHMIDFRKHHIVFYLYSLAGGGAEKVSVNLIKELVGRGVKIDLALNRITGPYLSELPEEVRVIGLNGFKNGFFQT
jgi:hypothetical protein